MAEVFGRNPKAMSGTRKIEAGLQCQNSGNRPGVKPPWANNAALALVTARVRLLISRETKMDGSVERQTMKKVAVRLVPFLCLLYIPGTSCRFRLPRFLP